MLSLDRKMSFFIIENSILPINSPKCLIASWFLETGFLHHRFIHSLTFSRTWGLEWYIFEQHKGAFSKKIPPLSSFFHVSFIDLNLRGAYSLSSDVKFIKSYKCKRDHDEHIINGVSCSKLTSLVISGFGPWFWPMVYGPWFWPMVH